MTDRKASLPNMILTQQFVSNEVKENGVLAQKRNQVPQLAYETGKTGLSSQIAASRRIDAETGIVIH